MNQVHSVRLSTQKFKDGLRIFECDHCDYAFAAKVDENGIIDLSTRVPINHGDLKASHTFMQVVDEVPTIEFEGSVESN